MAEPESPAIAPDETTRTEPVESHDSGWTVVVWNDPVNYMEFVTHVFMKIFAWPRPKAEKHMLEVHEKGRSVVARAGFEKAELYVHQLQGYSLHATLEKAG
jgi:ATP-dependent Clp protease adaptor protein ClpS